MAGKDSSIITREILDTIRNIQENKTVRIYRGDKFVTTVGGKNLIKEDSSGKELKAIAITDDPRFGQGVLTSQKEQFRSSVESGAQFSEPSEEDVSESPLIYMPETGNLVFGGIIPCLNNMKWQFVLKTNTGNGCFVWADGLILNKENMQILNKLYGFYLNWRDSWNSEAGDLEKMGQTFSEQ